MMTKELKDCTIFQVLTWIEGIDKLLDEHGTTNPSVSSHLVTAKTSLSLYLIDRATALVTALGVADQSRHSEVSEAVGLLALAKSMALYPNHYA